MSAVVFRDDCRCVDALARFSDVGCCGLGREVRYSNCRHNDADNPEDLRDSVCSPSDDKDQDNTHEMTDDHDRQGLRQPVVLELHEVGHHESDQDVKARATTCRKRVWLGASNRVRNVSGTGSVTWEEKIFGARRAFRTSW